MGERAEDIQQIMNATFTYARGLDLFRPEEALSAYTDDAYWDATAVGLKRYQGREELLGFFRQDAETMVEQYHTMTNHLIEFEDVYRRVDGRWLIAGRTISPLMAPRMTGFQA